VAYKERVMCSFDELSKVQWPFVNSLIAKEGLYMFGGIKTDPTVRDNNLYLLTIGDRKHKWEIVETKGK
jgi:hypothetical protein